jgi:hypothetical protein
MSRAAPTILAATLLLGGCASSYDLVLMPRSSGKTYIGEAVETAYGEQANVRVDIEGRVYTGTWVATTPGYGASNVSFGFGIGSWGGSRAGGVGVSTGTYSGENPYGSESKALLRSADGSGLRCDFRSSGPGRTGGGTCQDDQGLLYDVQIRAKENK